MSKNQTIAQLFATARTFKQGDRAGTRKLVLKKTILDDVSEKLGACSTADDLIKVAAEFGITKAEVQDRAARAPNFGQLRMVIGNRIRGIQRRAAFGGSALADAKPAAKKPARKRGARKPKAAATSPAAELAPAPADAIA